MKNKTLNRIYKIARPHLKIIILVSFLSLLVSVGEIVKPYIIEIAIDDFLSKGIYEKGAITLGVLGGIYIGVVIIGNVIDFLATIITNRMGEEVIYTIRNKLFRFTQYANISFHDVTSAGKLFVRLTNDVEDISLLFKDVVATIFKDILLIIALGAMMFYLNAKIAFSSLIIVIPLVLLSSISLTIILNKMYDYSKVIRTNLNTFFAESIYGAKIIKIFNIQKEKQKECENLTQRFRDARVPTGTIESLLPAIMTILENLGIAIIVTICTYNLFGINLEVGIIYVFVTYIKQLFEPITRIVENVEIVQEAVVSINKIYDILDQKQYLEDFEKGIELKNIKGEIEFKNVWFAYKDEDWVLKDISFKIAPRRNNSISSERQVLGKTTITNLVNRFYEIQKGEILIDGINIKDINLRSLRNHIGTVLQDPFIFALSIKDNIKLNKNLSDEDVCEAIEMASADEFIYSLKNRNL